VVEPLHPAAEHRLAQGGREPARAPEARADDERCGGEGGSKTYATAADAERYARAFDRRDAEGLGKRPLLSLLPLWLARKAGERSGSSRRP
jgi:hypothetical protein